MIPDAEREKVMAEIDALLDAAMPKPKPKPKLVLANELSLETDKERLAREQRRVMEREKAAYRRAAEQNQAIIRERQARAWIDPRSTYEKIVEGWAESRREIEAHERWFKRQFGNSGIWSVEPFHKDR